MNIKFKKTLTLSLLASMVITPTLALAINFNNESVSNVENNALNAREVSNNTPQDNKSFEDGIAGVISALNTNYESNKTKNGYFSDVFEFDLGLKFELWIKSWGLLNDWYKQKQGFNPTKKIKFYNDNSIKNDEILLNSPDFHLGKDGDLGGVKKDPNLKLSFNNTADHKEKLNGDKHLNQIGSVKNITSTYNSNFNLIGKLKNGEKGNFGDRILYACNEYWMVGQDYYLKAILNENLVNGTSEFFKPNSIKPQSIDRWVDVFSEEDSLKIFNMIFDNNYLPEAVNADGVKTSKDLDEFGKMIKFSDDFKVLKSIGDLNKEIIQFDNNVETYKGNEHLKKHLEKAGVISNNLKNGIFGGVNIAKITADLISIREIKIDKEQPDLKPLIDFIETFNNNISLNKEFSDLLTNLKNHGLLLNDEKQTIKNINFLYERLIGWLSVNNISFNINGVIHNVFENGIVNNLKEKLEIFKDITDRSITKKFEISEVKINRLGGEHNKNIFSNGVDVNSTSLTTPAFDKVKQEFLTDSNYKIAYSMENYTKEIKENTNSLARSIPVSILDKNLSEYLKNIDGNVEFTDDALWSEVEKHINKNIFNNIEKNENIFLSSESFSEGGVISRFRLKQ